MLLVTGAKNPRIIREDIMQKPVKISSVYFTIKLGSGRTSLANYYKPKSINAKFPINVITSNGRDLK
jgi:hypothetical protein